MRAADAYAFLHRQVERQIGFAHGRNRSGASIEASELAAAIRAERGKADSGGLFTPAATPRGALSVLLAMPASCVRVCRRLRMRHTHQLRIPTRLRHASQASCLAYPTSSNTDLPEPCCCWLMHTPTWLSMCCLRCSPVYSDRHLANLIRGARAETVRIQTSEIFCSVKYIDVVTIESRGDQGIHGGACVAGVGNRPGYSIGRIGNELIAAISYISGHDVLYLIS